MNGIVRKIIKNKRQFGDQCVQALEIDVKVQDYFIMFPWWKLLELIYMTFWHIP